MLLYIHFWLQNTKLEAAVIITGFQSGSTTPDFYK